MSWLSLRFANLSKRWRITLIATGIALAVILAAVVGYFALVPKKVMVRYGTIVRDPVDGYVWEDNTETIWVYPKDAWKYRVEYIDKLSEEHQKELAEKEAQEAAELAQLAQSQGIESLNVSITQQQKESVDILQHNIDVMGQDIMSGLEMISELNTTKQMLEKYYRQFASLQLPPNLQHLQQQVLYVWGLYIEATNLLIKAAETLDYSYVEQAQAKLNQANAYLESLFPK